MRKLEFCFWKAAKQGVGRISERFVERFRTLYGHDDGKRYPKVELGFSQIEETYMSARRLRDHSGFVLRETDGICLRLGRPLEAVYNGS